MTKRKRGSYPKENKRKLMYVCMYVCMYVNIIYVCVGFIFHMYLFICIMSTKFFMSFSVICTSCAYCKMFFTIVCRPLQNVYF